VQKLQEEEQALAKELAKLKTQADLKRGTIQDEEKHIEELQAAVEEVSKRAHLGKDERVAHNSHASSQTQLSAQRDEKKKTMGGASERFAALKSSYEASVASLQQSEDLLQSLVTGLSSSSTDSSSSGYMGQLAAARAKLASIGSEAEQARLRADHLQRELKEKEPRAKKAEGEGRGLISELEKAKEAQAKLEVELANAGWDEEREVGLRTAKEAAAAKVRELVDKKDAIKSRLAGLDFRYADPTPNFDRSKVKGLVATLVEVDPENYKNATALEVCAGGRLFNVRQSCAFDQGRK
jgi:structural maintenance of chromosome 2